MISLAEFERICSQELGRDISIDTNPDQHKAISSQPGNCLYIVAGPGSGKTTVLSLKVLKLIFVDHRDPAKFLVTTFTKKAAAELRSRLLGWGDQIRQALLANKGHAGEHERVAALDFNQIVTGTLDSIAEQLLTDNRPPGQPAPVVIEDFVANALMTRAGLFAHGRHQNPDLQNYVAGMRGSRFGLNVPALSEALRGIKDRIYHDQVDTAAYLAHSSSSGVDVAFAAIGDYKDELINRLLYDFAQVETEFYERLANATIADAVNGFEFLFVDEYQDTNLLQEAIYFEIAKYALNNGGSMSVVGDDDQSLYRFRGATVDLFQEFISRIRKKLGVEAKEIYLSTNYRSTPAIVTFCNDFVTVDAAYQLARVGEKPPIRPGRRGKHTTFPILGMFRDDIDELADDLSLLLERVIHRGGWEFADNSNKRYRVQVDSRGGSAGDIALLTSSSREFKSDGSSRLPALIRSRLQRQHPKTLVFNPRGQELRVTESVEIVCGLILLCIDPENAVLSSIERVPRDAVQTFEAWRSAASAYIARDPKPWRPRLRDFVGAWGRRVNLKGEKWSDRVSIVELVYKLVTWIPDMQSDIEGLVYLESVTRTVTQSALFSGFSGEIVVEPNDPGLEQASIREAIWNIFVPLATGAVDTNEDLLETLPRDRLNIMSIHQSKGLEFPFVIVDVGSDFKQLHHSHAFKRFPEKGGEPCNMEDEFRAYSPLNTKSRAARDRAFDDLIRQYFVAFSRAQDVLLLVGLTSVSDGYATRSGAARQIPNIATGWDRTGIWQWGAGLPNLVRI